MKSKSEKKAIFNSLASSRDAWRRKNSYYHATIERFLADTIPHGATVLNLGCGTGELLRKLNASFAVGVDFSEKMLVHAKIKTSLNNDYHVHFIAADIEVLPLIKKFDYIILSDVIGELPDIWTAFRSLHQVTHDRSRIIVTYYNQLWEPILKLGEHLGIKMPQDYQNWLFLDDIKHLLNLNGFEIVHSGYRLLIPFDIPILSMVVNKYIVHLPLVNYFCLSNYLIAKPISRTVAPSSTNPSVSIIIPCRNERGNIRNAVETIPEMGSHTEIIFVDGNSNDGTIGEIESIIAEYRDSKDIKLLHQVPLDSDDGKGHGKMLKLGKGDAVRKGFAHAKGDILMILDADLTVPPEDLPKFYTALAEGQGEFVNGSRLVYPMEKQAMRFLNKLANKFFGVLFSWLLAQAVTDTLCGTKALYKKDYEKIVQGRDYFGDFDPFGDFDLLFGAAKQNLKIIEIPVRYRERTYGEVKIERFKHGLLLLKMSWIGMKRLKFVI